MRVDTGFWWPCCWFLAVLVVDGFGSVTHNLSELCAQGGRWCDARAEADWRHCERWEMLSYQRYLYAMGLPDYPPEPKIRALRSAIIAVETAISSCAACYREWAHYDSYSDDEEQRECEQEIRRLGRICGDWAQLSRLRLSILKAELERILEQSKCGFAQELIICEPIYASPPVGRSM